MKKIGMVIVLLAMYTLSNAQNSITNDTTYVEKADGNLEMVITKRTTTKTVSKPTVTKVVSQKAQGTLDTTYVEDEKGNLKMIVTGTKVMRSKKSTFPPISTAGAKDTVYTEDKNGNLQMRIINKGEPIIK